MSIRVLIGFLPWILFYFLPFNTPLQIKLSISALLILTIITNYKDLERKFILPWVSLLFFTVIFVCIVIFNLLFLMSYMGILVHIVLVSVAFGSLAIGQPFIMQYARLSVVKEKWHSHIFIIINQALTFAWGVSFLLNLGINIFQKVHPSSQVIIGLMANGSTLAALIFTLIFPKWYRKKAEAKQN